MNIWLIQIGEPLPLQNSFRKQRLTMLSEKLAERGHKVVRWGSSFDHISKTMLFNEDTEIQYLPNITIKIIKGLGYKRNISIRRYLDHQVLSRKILNQAKSMPRPDVILVATPPHNVAYSVVKYANKHSIPVIVDIRDQWPDSLFEIIPKYLRPFLKALSYWEFKTLKIALSNANGLTSMQDSLLKWGLDYADRDRSWRDAVFFIGTDKLANKVNMSNVGEKLKKSILQNRNKFIVVFIGTFNTLQHPLIIVDVAERFLKEKVRNVVFILAGSGDFFKIVKEKAENLSNVILTGWLNQDEIAFLLRYSKVGICPLNKELPFFPNKAFIYLSASLPIISSTPGDLREIIEKYKIGLYYEPRDTNGLYHCIKKVVNDNKLLDEMRENIGKVFGDLFDSETIYDKFVKHIEWVVRDFHNQ